MAFGQKGQYFLWRVPELYNTDSKTKELASSKRCRKDGNMMYCNHTLPVGFIKFSLFTHSQAYYKRTHKKMYASAHTRRGNKGAWTHYKHIHLLQTPISLSLFSLPISVMRSRLPCRDCMRQTREQVFPPEEMRSKWESNMTALL